MTVCITRELSNDDLRRSSPTLLSLHHTKLPSYMKEMKKYHLAHHYKNFDLGFGVTSEHHFLSFSVNNNPSSAGKVWDIVFNTILPV